MIVSPGSCTTCLTPMIAAAKSYAYISRTHPSLCFATGSASMAAAMRSYSSMSGTRSSLRIIVGAGPVQGMSSIFISSLFSGGIRLLITSGSLG